MTFDDGGLMECWVGVRNHPKYEVSNLGQVRRAKDGRVLKQSPNTTNGAMRVYLDRKQYYVHRLVAEAFFNDDSGRVVRHRNGDKRDNSVSNLVKYMPDFGLQLGEEDEDLWP